MDYKALLENIMALDKIIRFSVIADKYGNIIMTRYRKGLKNFLTDRETKDTIQYAVEAWRIRHTHEEKLGKARFALVEYQKLLRTSIPLHNDQLLIITLDIAENDFEIIEKILNQIKFAKS
jgi:hypothetical protein